MAEKIGAASTHMNFAAVYGYGVPMSKDKNNRKGWIFRGHVMNLYGPITVGPDGKRFVNDDLGATSISQAMSRLGFKKVFQVATEAQLLDFMKNDPIQVIGWDQNTFKKELEEQKVFVVKADTIAELAKKMGLPADQLEATLQPVCEERQRRRLRPQIYEGYFRERTFLRLYRTADCRHLPGRFEG